MGVRLLPLILLCACFEPVLGEGSADLDHPRMQTMLTAHNAVRASASPEPDPPLDLLAWSDALAGDAAAWARQCPSTHDPDLALVAQGENLFFTSSAGERIADDVVDAWAIEAADYDLATDSCTGVCGHYTQIVWRETAAVGCAFQACLGGLRGNPDMREVWVCRYSPPGNVRGQAPY